MTNPRSELNEISSGDERPPSITPVHDALERDLLELNTELTRLRDYVGARLEPFHMDTPTAVGAEVAAGAASPPQTAPLYRLWNCIEEARSHTRALRTYIEDLEI